MKTPRGSTLADVQQTHILRVLAETNAILGGPRGAALRMGMKRTTLQSLMGLAPPGETQEKELAWLDASWPSDLSADGKTRTSTVHLSDASGKQVTSTLVYGKQ